VSARAPAHKARAAAEAALKTVSGAILGMSHSDGLGGDEKPRAAKPIAEHEACFTDCDWVRQMSRFGDSRGGTCLKKAT